MRNGQLTLGNNSYFISLFLYFFLNLFIIILFSFCVTNVSCAPSLFFFFLSCFLNIRSHPIFIFIFCYLPSYPNFSQSVIIFTFYSNQIIPFLFLLFILSFLFFYITNLFQFYIFIVTLHFTFCFHFY